MFKSINKSINWYAGREFIYLAGSAKSWNVICTRDVSHLKWYFGPHPESTAAFFRLELISIIIMAADRVKVEIFYDVVSPYTWIAFEVYFYHIKCLIAKIAKVKITTRCYAAIETIGIWIWSSVLSFWEESWKRRATVRQWWFQLRECTWTKTWKGMHRTMACPLSSCKYELLAHLKL